MADNSGIRYRVATSADKDAVFAINQSVYIGLDYFPDRYDDTINDPSCFSYVLENEGEIIGFMGHRVLEQGTVSLAGNMRLKSIHQGKGLLKKLDQYILKKVQQKHPAIKIYRYATADTDQVEKRTQNPDSGYHVTCQTMQYCLRTTPSIISTKLETISKSETGQTISAKEIMTTANYDTLRLENFGHIFYYDCRWIPEQPTWENLASMAGEYASYVTIQNEKACSAFSVSDLHLSGRGYVITLHFSTHDFTCFPEHFKNHLEEMLRTIPGGENEFYIRVGVPSAKHNIKSFLLQFGELEEESLIYCVDRHISKCEHSLNK